MKKIVQILGGLFVFSSIGGFIDGQFIQGLIVLAMGIGLLYLSKNMKTKNKKQLYTFNCEVKGHFLHERQRILSRAFRDNYQKDIEDDETLLFNKVELVPEPTNKYDQNAIRIDLIGYSDIGYIPREKTEELRKVINLEEEYKTYLTIYKDVKEYFADLQVQQKR